MADKSAPAAPATARPFPSPRLGGPEHRLHALHVADGIFERLWYVGPVQHRLRESIALDRVLVAHRKRLQFPLAPERILARVYDDLTVAIGRGVERNADFDQPESAEDLNPLVVGHLRAAGPGQVDAVVVEQHRSE